MINTYTTKPEALKHIEYNINFIRNVFGYTVRFLRLDRETSLQRAFDDFVRNISIKPERSAPDTQEQNRGSKRAGRTVVTKGRAIRVDANIPIDLQPECIKTAGYLANRTPVRSNFQKSLYEIVIGEKPKHSHLHPLRCKAYVLNHDLPKRERRNKLYPRTHIGYLVGYNSTNIQQIWIPSKSRVIRTRDVTFDDNSIYSLFELDIGAVIRESADRIIETLDITDRADDDLVSDNKSTLDYIIVEVPASLEASLKEERSNDSANQSP